MENQSLSKTIIPDENLLKLSQELSQAWGTDYHRIRALICQLSSGKWYSTSDLISLSAISHWHITHLLGQLEPWLENAENQVRFYREYINMITTIFDCSSIPAEAFMPPYEVAARANKVAAQSHSFLS